MFENLRIILVEPQHPGNIGAGARAMKNMGFNDLWLVNPKRFPDPQADWRAAGATDLLESSRVRSTLNEAIADCQLVIGTSARVRNIPRPSIFAKELPGLISCHPADLKVAILFGREDSGLTNDELQLCHYHLQIPSDEGYPVLNVAMALQIVVYELFISASGKQKKEAEWDRPIASSNEVEMMLEHLEQVLFESEFLDRQNPGKTLVRLRRMFMRIKLDETEVQMMRGILKHLRKRPTN